jgi:hypothetical protein
LRSSLMRFSDPLRRKIPSTSVAMAGVSAWGVWDWLWDRHALLFQVDAAFGNDYRDIAVDVALALLVEQRDGDIGIADAGLERDAEDALGSCATNQQISM